MKKGRCRLCLKGSLLHDSHIIPAWVFRRAENAGGSLIRVEDDKAFYDSTQKREHLLCSACERRAKLIEDVAADLSVQLDGSFPALDLLEATIGVPPGPNGARAKRLRHAESLTLAEFGVLVIWRASVSRRHFRKVTLGAHEEGFRRLLNGEAQFPARLSILLHLIDDPTIPRESIIVDPFISPGSNPSHSCFVFSVAGLHFTLFVGDGIPSSAFELCLVNMQRVVVGTLAALRNVTSSRAETARPVGKLGANDPRRRR